MRRSILAIILLVSTVSPVRADQIGGLATNAGERGLTLSAGISYIVKNIKNSGLKQEMTARKLEVKSGYGLIQNLDLNLKLGFADLKTDNFEGRLDALYGAGLRFKLFKDTEDRVNVYLDGEVSKFSSGDSKTSADVVDYRAAVIVSNRAGNMTPYGGVKVSETELTFSNTSSKFIADKHVGIFAGIDYFVNPNVFFNGEINIFDQDALYLGVGYKF